MKDIPCKGIPKGGNAMNLQQIRSTLLEMNRLQEQKTVLLPFDV